MLVWCDLDTRDSTTRSALQLGELESYSLMNTNKLLTTGAYSEAVEGWSEPSDTIRLGQKIRVTFEGLKPKTGYAYREDGAWLGIRYTWRSHRWWSLLNYNNPLVKLEVEELDGQGRASYRTLWERSI
jgi:hypothetical protein